MSSYDKLVQYCDQLFAIAHDIESILSTNENFLLGRWLSSAKSWAKSPQEMKQLERNARIQITSWGLTNSNLLQYAYKMWAGLINDYYIPRWNVFTDMLKQSVKLKIPFDHVRYEQAVQDIEWQWEMGNTIYPIISKGDIISLSKQIYVKWFGIMNKG
jgi:alpha-N-acetylglucosaminidase